MVLSSRLAVLFAIAAVLAGGVSIYVSATDAATQVDAALRQEDDHVAAALKSRLLADAEQSAATVASLVQAEPASGVTEAFGQSMREAIGAQALFLVGDKGRLVWTAVSLETSAALGRTKAVTDVAAYASRMNGPQHYSGFLYCYGQTYVASAIRQPMANGAAVVVIVLKRLDDGLLASLSRDYGLVGLDFSLKAQPGKPSIELLDIRSTRMGYLAWEQDSPMQQMVEMLSPRVATAVAGVGIIVIALIALAFRAHRQAESARIATAVLAKSERAKSMLFANLSHEFRTPLNAVLGFSEAMKMGLFGPLGHPRYAEYAGDIHSSASHLLGLIEDVLMLSRYDATDGVTLNEPIDLGPCIADACRMLEQQATQKGLMLSIDEMPEAAALASGRGVRQVVVNLVGNAIKYTEFGYVRIAAAQAPSDDCVAFAVSDSGIGIPEEHLDRILRPFEQVDDVYARKQGGTGLGLSIVGTILARCGGSMSISSVPGKGTTVTVVLRRAPKAAAAKSEALAA